MRRAGLQHQFMAECATLGADFLLLDTRSQQIKPHLHLVFQHTTSVIACILVHIYMQRTTLAGRHSMLEGTVNVTMKQLPFEDVFRMMALHPFSC